MQSSHLPPLALWETCYPVAPLRIFHWGRPVPCYVAVSVLAMSKVIPPVPGGFGLWAPFSEVLAIVLGTAEEETRHLWYPVLVFAGSLVCLGFWWLFFIAFLFYVFYRRVIPCTLPDRIQNKNQIAFICRICWNIESYWELLLKNAGLLQGVFLHSWEKKYWILFAFLWGVISHWSFTSLPSRS